MPSLPFGISSALGGSTDTFPALPGLDVEVHRSEIYRTSTQIVDSGKELRRNIWGPRYRYTLKINLLRTSAWPNQSTDELVTLINFIEGHSGNAFAFNYTDPFDGTVRVCRFDFQNSSGSTGGTEEVDIAQVVSHLFECQEIDMVSLIT